MVSWLALFTLVGCRDAAFLSASRMDTAQGYRDFIRTHPEDPDRPAAEARLAELEFDAARRAHTVLAYKRFLEQFPDSTQATAAGALLEALRFNAAMEARTPGALAQFLRDHPAGAHRAEAEEALRQARLDELTASPDAERIRQALASSPEDSRVEVARARLDDDTFAAASSAAALWAYLERQPAGRHRDEARVRLLSLRLDALLAADDLEGARALLDREPLAARLEDGAARVEAARRLSARLAALPDALARGLSGYTLRPVDELVRSLQAPDPLERWQAAEELGFAVTPAVLSPLVQAAIDARLELIRWRALDSLARVVRALPPAVAEYELTERLRALEDTAADSRRLLTRAVLEDLRGDARAAALSYQRAFEPTAPDALILRRWASLRLQRGERFSAAVAARQLALHASQAAVEAPSAAASTAVAAARALCSAADEARAARALIERVATGPVEFPDDVTAFLAQARGIEKEVEARLRDAELELLRERPTARLCAHDGVTERMAAGERQRLELLGALHAPLSDEARVVITLASTRDPSPKVREAARALSISP